MGKMGSICHFPRARIIPLLIIYVIISWTMVSKRSEICDHREA